MKKLFLFVNLFSFLFLFFTFTDAGKSFAAEESNLCNIEYRDNGDIAKFGGTCNVCEYDSINRECIVSKIATPGNPLCESDLSLTYNDDFCTNLSEDNCVRKGVSQCLIKQQDEGEDVIEYGYKVGGPERPLDDKCISCVRRVNGDASQGDPDCDYTNKLTCEDAATSGTGEQKFKCVSNACVDCNPDEEECISSSECETACKAPAATCVPEECFSGQCSDGACVTTTVPLACVENVGYDPLSGNILRTGSYTCNTAIGQIDVNPQGFTRSVLRLLLGLAGGILLVLIIINGYKMMTSQGDPEKIKDAREGIIAAIAGILLIIFSLTLLQLITADIIGIPGFG